MHVCNQNTEIRGLHLLSFQKNLQLVDTADKGCVLLKDCIATENHKVINQNQQNMCAKVASKIAVQY